MRLVSVVNSEVPNAGFLEHERVFVSDVPVLDIAISQELVAFPRALDELVTQ